MFTEIKSNLLYSFFWVTARRLNFMYRCFGTISPIFIGRVNRTFFFTPPMKMEQTECSEMSAHKIQTPGNHPKERIKHSQHGESLKSSKSNLLPFYFRFFTAIFYADTMYIRPIQRRKRTTCYMNVVKSQPPSPRH